MFLFTVQYMYMYECCRLFSIARSFEFFLFLLSAADSHTQFSIWIWLIACTVGDLWRALDLARGGLLKAYLTPQHAYRFQKKVARLTPPRG